MGSKMSVKSLASVRERVCDARDRLFGRAIVLTFMIRPNIIILFIIYVKTFSLKILYFIIKA
jgi:hypothetical protein